MSKTGCCPAVGEAGWNWGSAIQQQTWMETVFHGFYWKCRVKVTVATAKDYLGARSTAVEGSENMEGGPLHKGVRPIARNLFGFPGYFFRVTFIYGCYSERSPGCNRRLAYQPVATSKVKAIAATPARMAIIPADVPDSVTRNDVAPPKLAGGGSPRRGQVPASTSKAS